MKKAVKKAATKKVVKKAVEKSASAKRSGRPKGTGKYGCETKAVRVPKHLVAEIEAFIKRKIK